MKASFKVGGAASFVVRNYQNANKANYEQNKNPKNEINLEIWSTQQTKYSL